MHHSASNLTLYDSHPNGMKSSLCKILHWSLIPLEDESPLPSRGRIWPSSSAVCLNFLPNTLLTAGTCIWKHLWPIPWYPYVFMNFVNLPKVSFPLELPSEVPLILQGSPSIASFPDLLRELDPCLLMPPLNLLSISVTITIALSDTYLNIHLLTRRQNPWSHPYLEPWGNSAVSDAQEVGAP